MFGPEDSGRLVKVEELVEELLRRADEAREKLRVIEAEIDRDVRQANGEDVPPRAESAIVEGFRRFSALASEARKKPIG